MWQSVSEFFKHVVRRTLRSCWILFKLMIPVSIIIRIIQEFNLLDYCSGVLSPLMSIVGLPAETAIVWLTAMVVNIYGGLLSLFSIYPTLAQPLTHAQITVLVTMILVAHTFPVELGIAKKTGVKLWIMFLIRFVGAMLIGIILNLIYSLTGTLQESMSMPDFLVAKSLSWGDWALNELKNYGVIMGVIFILVCFVHLLEVTGFIELFNKFMQPTLGWLGISKKMLPLTIIGLTMGLAYGGGLIIEEGDKNKDSAKDIFYSMTLMGLFHSIFEDTILMLSVGGHWTGVILVRAIFATLSTFVIVKCTCKIEESKFVKRFMTQHKEKKS